MDQKNLPLFIAISIAILLGSQYFFPHKNQAPRLSTRRLISNPHSTPTGQTPLARALDPGDPPGTSRCTCSPPPSANAPRLSR